MRTFQAADVIKQVITGVVPDGSYYYSPNRKLFAKVEPKRNAMRLLQAQRVPPAGMNLQMHEGLTGNSLVDTGYGWTLDYYKQNEREVGYISSPRIGKTGKIPVPLIHPDRPTGELAIENGLTGNIWVAMHLEAGVGLFDPATKSFQVYPVPGWLMQPNMRTSQLAVAYAAVASKVWTSAGADFATRIDVKTVEYEAFYSYADLTKTALPPQVAKANIPVPGLGGGEGAGTQSRTAGRPASVGGAARNVIYGTTTDSRNHPTV